MPEACPGCGAIRRYTRNPCDDCGLVALETYMQSPAGRLLSHIADIDAMLQCPGFAVTAEDLDVETFRALRVLWSERDKYVKEERRRADQKARQDAEAAKRNGR